MKCEYCDVEVTVYPETGICPCCGGKLPPRPAPRPAARPKPVPVILQPVQVPIRQQMPLQPGINCCPKCRSSQITYCQRGFSLGWGLLWFFLLPPFGILLGLCGRKKVRVKCTRCNHKWKPLTQ